MKTESAKDVLARNVKALRLHRGWNQTSLAQKAGVSQRTVSNIENPAKNPGYSPTVDAIDGIAKAFGLSLYHLSMPVDLDVLLDLSIEKTIQYYAKSTKEGRENITRIAECEMRYSSISGAGTGPK